MDRLKGSFYGFSRALESFVPLGLLWWLLLSLSTMLAARHSRRISTSLPVRSLPAHPSDRPPSNLARLRYLIQFQTHWWLLGWLDRLAERRWQSRVEGDGLEHLHETLAHRPVIVVTLHTTSVVALAAWISSPASPPRRCQPIRAGFAARPDAARCAGRRAGHGRLSAWLEPRDRRLPTARPRDRPCGRPHRDSVNGGGCGAATVTTNSGPFRLARLAGAALVPMLITTTGLCRYRVAMMPAVDQHLMESGAVAAAAEDVVRRLFPLAAKVPRQAMQTLVDAVSQTR